MQKLSFKKKVSIWWVIIKKKKKYAYGRSNTHDFEKFHNELNGQTSNGGYVRGVGVIQ